MQFRSYFFLRLFFLDSFATIDLSGENDVVCGRGTFSWRGFEQLEETMEYSIV